MNSSGTPLSLLLCLVCALAGCPQPPPPPPPQPEWDPAAYEPVTSGLRNADVVAASERLVPYEVERGGTLYAIRDVVAAAGRASSVRDRSEAWFLAAAATVDLVLYADLTGDARPLAGLGDVWGATDRDGTLAAVVARLEALGGTFVPSAVRNALAVARGIASRDGLAGPDVATLNALAANGGPLSFQARVVLLAAQADLLESARAEGPDRLVREAPRLVEGVPDPAGDAWAGLPDGVRPAARLLAATLRTAAGVREAAALEPLGILLAGRLDGALAVTSAPGFPLPVDAADLPDSGSALVRAVFEGPIPSGRVHVYAAADRITVGVTDVLRAAADGIKRIPSGYGDPGQGSSSCAVPVPLPEPPRSLACLRSALSDARGVAYSNRPASLAVGGTEGASAALLAAVLREAVAAGFERIELFATVGDGRLAALPVGFSDDRALAAAPGTVRIAAGGFYVGGRGDLVHIPRATGVYDYAALGRLMAGREPPLAIQPASATTLPVVLGAVAAVRAATAGSAGVPLLLPPQ
ncbi:MAG: hypothetical protein QME96_09595 [Myxococcota bacterium]|nr:hypothetical protein [Myxococcota bacterium]